MVDGNTDGIKKCYLEELDYLHKIKTSKEEVCNLDIINVISRISGIIDREISVAIDRRGNVVSVAVGDSTKVELPVLDIREHRLSGVRIIHTHPNGYSNL